MDEYYGLGNRGNAKTENEEFQEDEVWAAAIYKERREVIMMKKSSPSSSWRLPVIRRTNSHEQRRVEQSSAPVNVPDWFKIYRGCSDAVLGYEDHDDGDDEKGVVPPHEYIAKRIARSEIASFSMCEGVGRTLKGRDLSKLRNAILTKTGFLEG